ncbi:hypothetical protein [Streptomyces sp. 021-4]|uniref:Orn/Lys/Arg family decarboxylase n=1 Tax=Streptomyces sp. 021-4 TaxID=2789260 RepID=UPI0039F484AC
MCRNCPDRQTAQEWHPAPVGRICADTLVPYPPGIPAVLPGAGFRRAERTGDRV